MTYVPGDNWTICDLSGKKVLMSDTRKTWDGLRVWSKLHYPKHPQLSVRAIPERSMAVKDARPRPADIYLLPQFGLGSFCLKSPSGIDWTFGVEDDGALTGHQITWGTPQRKLELVPGYLFTVDDDGALHVGPAPIPKRDPAWRMYSVNGVGFDLTVDPDFAVILTIVSGPDYAEGVFSLISPNGTSYVVYIVDDMAVLVRPGSWGPASTHHFLDTWKMSVANDGALIVEDSGERFSLPYRMVSIGGFEYMWHVDPDGAVKIESQGHWWEVPVTVHLKPNDLQDFIKGTYDATGQVTEDGQHSWLEV